MKRTITIARAFRSVNLRRLEKDLNAAQSAVNRATFGAEDMVMDLDEAIGQAERQEIKVPRHVLDLRDLLDEFVQGGASEHIEQSLDVLMDTLSNARRVAARGRR